MLPIIDIPFESLVDVSFNFRTVKDGFLGQVFVFHWVPFFQFCSETKENVDQVLTKFILTHFYQKSYKSRVLICYAPYKSLLKLICCSKG